MIVGVPDHSQLHQTAVGWLNLAWQLTINEVAEFHEFNNALDEIQEGHRIAEIDSATLKFWTSAQYRLNNAISILQQSLEIFLKARIAEVSPYLLIASDPQSWRKPNPDGDIDFSDLKTLDAVHLCKIVNIVSSKSLPSEFIRLYDRLRKARNKISHLNGRDIQAKANEIIVDILYAHKYLFPSDTWVKFRNECMSSTREYSDDELLFDGTDHTHDRLVREIDAALVELKPRYVKLFFHYDANKDRIKCPQCCELGTKYSDSEWLFAQEQGNNTIRCIACLAVYTREEYQERMGEVFGYPDNKE